MRLCQLCVRVCGVRCVVLALGATLEDTFVLCVLSHDVHGRTSIDAGVPRQPLRLHEVTCSCVAPAHASRVTTMLVICMFLALAGCAAAYADGGAGFADWART